MAGFKKSGTDLDALFEPLGSLIKRADVGIKISSVDISNNYAPVSYGSSYGTTNYLANGTDIGTLFAAAGTVAISGALWTWGRNSQNQLGDTTSVNKSSPVQTVAAGTNWSSITSGYQHTAAIKTDGTLWIWGLNGNGQLGDNVAGNKSSPIQTIAGGTNWKLVACGHYHTAAIKTDGTLWTWGQGTQGALGNNAAVNINRSPVQTIAAGTNWQQVACGYYNTAAIKTDGTLWTWGYNTNGPLGDNTIVAKSSPVQTIAGGTNWKQVAGSYYQTAAIKTNGTLWTWGWNNQGYLGDNTTGAKSSPIQTIAGGTNWKQVACSQYNTGAVKTDGTLWLWGGNGYYQLGDRTNVAKSSPVQTTAAGTNWKQVACGQGHNFISVKTDGTLWTWGGGFYGQIGDNTNVTKSSPVQTIAGGNTWKLVASGEYQVVAIK